MQHLQRCRELHRQALLREREIRVFPTDQASCSATAAVAPFVRDAEYHNQRGYASDRRACGSASLVAASLARTPCGRAVLNGGGKLDPFVQILAVQDVQPDAAPVQDTVIQTGRNDGVTAFRVKPGSGEWRPQSVAH